MKSSLLKLKSLVDDLTDRDLRLKEETKLLDYVFSDFPIPILVWSVDLGGEIKALRGNSILNPNAECEDGVQFVHLVPAASLQQSKSMDLSQLRIRQSRLL